MGILSIEPLKRRRHLVLGVVFFMTIFWAATTALLQPRYMSHAFFIPHDQADIFIQRIQSIDPSSFFEVIAKDLELSQQAEYNKNLPWDDATVVERFQQKLDAWIDGLDEPKSLDASLREIMKKNLTITIDLQKNIVDLAFVSRNPGNAARIANHLVEAYVNALQKEFSFVKKTQKGSNLPQIVIIPAKISYVPTPPNFWILFLLCFVAALPFGLAAPYIADTAYRRWGLTDFFLVRRP